MSRRKQLTALGLFLFLAVFFLLGFGAVSQLKDRPFDPSLTALFPVNLTETDDPVLEAAVHEKLSGHGAQTVTVLVSLKSDRLSDSARREMTVAAAEEVQRALVETQLFTPVAPSPEVIDAFRPTAGRLMSDEMRLRLLETLTLPDASNRLMDLAIANLSNPSAPKLMGFQNDPFGLFDSWIAQRQKELGTTPAMGKNGPISLLVKDDPMTATAVLPFKTQIGVAESGEGRLTEALNQVKEGCARLFAERYPEAGVSIIAAGVPLFTDAVAATAQSELTMIGAVSSVCVLTFALFLFGRLGTVLSMALTVAVGFWTGLAVSLTGFGTLSLITFVFGATLIGVTVDYSAHWFSSLTDPAHGGSPWATQKRLIPALTLAALSTAIAYGLLATAPLPGLRQMALFAAAGVTGAYLTVILLLPFITRLRENDRPCQPTRLMTFFTELFPRFPRFNKEHWATPPAFVSSIVFVMFIAGGLWQLTPDTGVRDLQGVPDELMADHEEVSRKLALPSPAQVFLIEGRTLDQVLEREETLQDAIAALGREKPQFSNIRPFALSNWMQSHRHQTADLILAGRAVQEIAEPMEALLGAAPKMPSDTPLTLDLLEKGPAADLIRRTVLLHNEERTATLFYLSGLTPRVIPFLKAIDSDLRGTVFVDMTGALNKTFTLYRDRVMLLLIAGLAALLMLLRIPFGRDAWRSLLPAALGILTAVAVLGWTGVPFTLFSALACVLLLGLGVDCGIFLSGAPTDGRAWTAVFFSGLTTMLSFGLLALSSTPALSAFGITILTGQIVIWAIAPLVRPKARAFRRKTPSVKPESDNLR